MSTPPAPMQPPQQPTRSKPKLVTGIVLTVLGGLALLSQAAMAGQGRTPRFSGPAEGAGYLIGMLLVGVVPLIIGIVLIVRSKRKA